MKNDDEIMTVEEFFGETENNKGAGCTIRSRRRGGRAKKTFADIKARMVMRIYGVTRAKAEKIISDRAGAKTEVDAAADPDRILRSRGADEDELMSAEEFFRG